MGERLFSQKELDGIVKERLAREQRRYERELVELESGLETAGTNYRKLYIEELKRKSLLDAGFTLDNVEQYVKFIEDSEDVEAVKRQAKEISKLAGLDGSGKKETKDNGWNPFKQ
ncbi:hypothetical protein M3196_13890 [Fictibacillus nanhaiensis]|uniref:hypothetical protein n=1 Tax=Fictibacillus nanhaiensis TaxID=742169 RepID=UPI00203D9EE0|nr:hypothetical protein [Fictibacillus nanhaiensis]MCM3732741.1 hypothetical protein [Fictibacillus nanhaiensis]